MTGYATAMHTVAIVTLTLDLQLCTRVTGDGKGAHTSVMLRPQTHAYGKAEHHRFCPPHVQ